MKTLSGLSATDSTLITFWERTRLRSLSTTETSGSALRTHRGGKADLNLRWRMAQALGLGCGLRPETVASKGAAIITARTVPSAGALFPYEIYASMPGDPSSGRDAETCFYDVEGRILRPFVPQGPDAIAGAAGLTPELCSQGLGVVAVVARPWLSMRKYGDRGYLYTCLDVAHVVVGIVRAAEAVGLTPVVCLRFRRKALAEALTLHEAGREPQVLVVFTAADAQCPEAGAAPDIALGTEPHVLDRPGDFEMQAWSAVRRVSAFEESFSPPQRVARTTSLTGWTTSQAPQEATALTSSDRAADTLEEFRRIALRRASARGFLPLPMAADALKAALLDLHESVRIDCADDAAPGVSMNIAASGVAGLPPAVYHVNPGLDLALVEGSATAFAEEDFARACMNQRVVRCAVGLAVIYAPLRDVLGRRGRIGLTELHFHAGHVAHKLCLAAARHGFGITCIGGFDERLLSEMVGLKQHEDVIYVLAFGIADPNATKLDREAIAFAHGATALQVVTEVARSGESIQG